MQHGSDWEYLAEGNANVVFHYTGRPSTLLSGKVLRLRKSARFNCFTAEEQQEYLKSVILPHLGHLADKVLVGDLLELDGTLLQECCEALRFAQRRRPEKYQSSFVESGIRYGVLLPYLKAETDLYRVIEFKPKWLSQSRSAPSTARFCRTCALRGMRGKDPYHTARFCPLDLVSNDRARIRTATAGLNQEQAWSLSASALDAVITFFLVTNMFHQLRDLQISAEDDLPLCMTLRDCSVFLMLNKRTNVVDQAWMTDFDRKSPDKLTYWNDIEFRLVHEGWFEGGYPRSEFVACISVDTH